ncbi:hypothetical protein BTO30_01090 [Domibacillus antri]|uniref:Flagellin n=1 Tax=Domibacillus antri TaxID=1714264 RepID=A0A1Q8Q9L9_9BACI|nr:flagellin [Domibacillus antri]OLN24044.1 hypothetical protein BTO30_01090 [Domibacillus antri]
MRINHNIQALNAYRNLNSTHNATSKSLEKLSSGLRINRAADDAAGLAISEKMRSQIRGLEMAERNALDAISLIQTAEGALSSTHAILQRMRELAVQASNGTLEDTDRQVIQDEIDQLTYEIDRIAKTTQFNQKVLFSSQKQAFAEINSNEVAYAGSGGIWSGTITSRPTKPAKVNIEFSSGAGALSGGAIDGQTFIINGKTYEVNTNGSGNVTFGRIAVDIASWSNSGTQASKAANINKLITALGAAIDKEDPLFNFSTAMASSGAVNSGVLKLETTQPMSPADVQNMIGDNEAVSTSLSGSVSFKNPYTTSGTTTLGASMTSDTPKNATLSFNDLPSAGDELKMDGLTIYFGTLGVAYSSGKLTIDVTESGLTISSLLTKIKSGFTTAQSSGAIASGHLMTISKNAITLSTIRTDDGGSNGLEFRLKDNDYETAIEHELTLGFQIGANEKERLSLRFNVMDASSLGIGRKENRIDTTAVGVEAVKGVNVSTTSGAEQAITIFDNAIRLVSTERSKLGAIQNRLEHTTTNLQTAAENLTASESRIRDLDMAKEMTQFTRNNILNQAGQAMLAQANQLPQGVLQLLQ